jgi:hypothetical protein
LGGPSGSLLGGFRRQKPSLSSLPTTGGHGPDLRYRPVDLVVTVGGYPTLYEVIGVCDAGPLHLRGINWAAGYSALVAAEGVRPASALLREA